MSEAERLREQAERCIRLARDSLDRGFADMLMQLAAEYQGRALEIERSDLPSSPAPSQAQPVQQQQQQQPQPKNQDE